MNQLIVFFGGIGDTILLSPAVKQLAQLGDITFIGYPERISLLKNAGWVKAIFTPEQVDFETIFSKPSQKLKLFLTQFTKAYFFLRDPQKILQVAKNCNIKESIAIPGIPPENWTAHASEYYLSTLNLKKDNDFIIPLPSYPLHNKIIIHPGSGSTKKNMPLQFFIDLTNHFLSLHREVIWSLGPAEEGITPPPGIQVITNLPLLELAKYLKAAPLYIGNDSGISHIAGAIGTPTIVLFKSTNPTVWKPLGPRVFPILATQPDTLHQILHISHQLITL